MAKAKITAAARKTIKRMRDTLRVIPDRDNPGSARVIFGVPPMRVTYFVSGHKGRVGRMSH